MPYKDPKKQKEYHAAYSLRWRKIRGNLWYKKQLECRRKTYEKVNEYKRARSCVDCGYLNKNFPLTLDFDHVRGRKLFNIAAFNGVSWKKILSEIKKCDLVCSNCHRIRSQKRIDEKKKGGVVR